MKELINSAKDFKIIPNNFKSSGAFNILETTENEIVAELILLDDKELSDYSINSNVEVFGVNNLGLHVRETLRMNRGNILALFFFRFSKYFCNT